jgi:glycosyltransferase involved in cell wall biosynthesis
VAEAELAAQVPKARVLPPVDHPIHLLRRPLALARVAALRLLRGTPYLAGKWDSRTVRAELARRLAEAPVDIVYIDHLGMAHYLDDVRRLCPRARVVIEAHNVESDLFRQFAERHRGPLHLLGHREWRLTQRFERRVLPAADAVAAISAEDAAALQALTGARPVVVPQVVPFTRTERPFAPMPRLCYVGTLNWHPNVQGLDWFIAEVWPLLRARLPGISLHIAGSGLPAGRDGAPRVPPAWRVPGVEVLGYVPDLEPLYRSARTMVAPILSGSGVRIKLLEALRAGMPVVTTPQGAAGLPLQDGREAIIAAGPAAFAEGALRLCQDPALGRNLREAGYDYLTRHHSMEAAQAAMRQVLQGNGRNLRGGPSTS